LTTGNPLFDRQKDKGSHGRSAEKRAAKRLGGRVRPGSGALDGAKGDITVKKFLIENKAVSTDSISIKLDWLLKIYAESISAGLTPALAFQFVHGSGISELRNRWVMIPEDVFLEMLGDEHD
jgi:hypothetical protein